jgi:biopolymer transport protein ExbD
MPSIKIPKKSTDTDMAPFVDIAFLILSFFIMATKFKPAEPVPVETQNSVSAEILKENNALMITISPDNKVFVSISSLEDPNNDKKAQILTGLNNSRNLGLSPTDIQNFRTTEIVGVPFSSLKGYLQLPKDQQDKFNAPGIMVSDSLNNELVWWVSETKRAFAGKKLLYLIKGDNNSKYPSFEAVVDALRRNEEFKYHLITSREEAPAGTDLYRERTR